MELPYRNSSYAPFPTRFRFFPRLFSIFMQQRSWGRKALCFAFDDGCCRGSLQPACICWRCYVFNNNCVAYFSALGQALNFKGVATVAEAHRMRPRQTVYCKSITAKKFSSANCKGFFPLPDFAGTLLTLCRQPNTENENKISCR